MTAMKLVPVEPTEEILNAGADAWRRHNRGDPYTREIPDIYKSMLAAAPSPATVDAGLVERLRKQACDVAAGRPVDQLNFSLCEAAAAISQLAAEVAELKALIAGDELVAVRMQIQIGDELERNASLIAEVAAKDQLLADMRALHEVANAQAARAEAEVAAERATLLAEVKTSSHLALAVHESNAELARLKALVAEKDEQLKDIREEYAELASAGNAAACDRIKLKAEIARLRAELGAANQAHHGAPILTHRDMKILSCVSQWIRVAREYAGFGYGDDWLPGAPDFAKSRLFWRLRSGLKPLPHPPPTCYSCPWYEVVEELSPHWTLECWTRDGNAYIGQCAYKVEQSAQDGTPQEVSFGPWRFKVWADAHPKNPDTHGWYIQRIDAARSEAAKGEG